MAKKTKDNDGLVWGIILIGLGIMFLLQQLFDLSVFSWIWQFWPLILVVWGIVVIKQSRG